MTPAHLIALFGVGCAANSLITWLAAIHPHAHTVGRTIYVLAGILLLAGLVLDDLVYPHFRMTQGAYYLMLAAIFMSIAIGGGLIWLAP